MIRTVVEKSFRENPNAELIEPPEFSDGSPDWHPDENQVRDAHDLINFYTPMDEDDHTYLTWVYKLGDGIAMGSTDPRDARYPPTLQYRLVEFPANYVLYRHAKQVPPGEKRTAVDLDIVIAKHGKEEVVDARGDYLICTRPPMPRCPQMRTSTATVAADSAVPKSSSLTSAGSIPTPHANAATAPAPSA
ncbi:hypothetical protein BC937DRAFT_88694 [Endogone sp. FLAS-F59071]|nr:hypothetical protein BC937DRAFT_88694 [Endogone sp. FLAS-F59071]|eukprot:RUS18504.1 hypothetical protein BC937DRAFT_88694 [Endogone sp. FLAS-F59071]